MKRLTQCEPGSHSFILLIFIILYKKGRQHITDGQNKSKSLFWIITNSRCRLLNFYIVQWSCQLFLNLLDTQQV